MNIAYLWIDDGIDKIRSYVQSSHWQKEWRLGGGSSGEAKERHSFFRTRHRSLLLRIIDPSLDRR